QFDSLTFNWAVWITIGHQILAYARQRPELHGGAVKRPVYDGFTEASEIILQQRKNVQCLRITESRVVLDQANAITCGHESPVQDPAVRCLRVLADRLGNTFIDGLRFLNLFRRQKREAMVSAGVGAHPAGVWSTITFERSLVILDGRHMHERPPIA